MADEHSAAGGNIARTIVLLRGQRVLLDSHLATLYGAPVKALNQAVRRNRERFPADFMFRLTPHEVRDLRSQTVTSSSWGGRRTRLYAFTEQGVAMLARFKVVFDAIRALMAPAAPPRRQIGFREPR